jgi:hypothetical protein
MGLGKKLENAEEQQRTQTPNDEFEVQPQDYYVSVDDFYPPTPCDESNHIYNDNLSLSEYVAIPLKYIL